MRTRGASVVGYTLIRLASPSLPFAPRHATHPHRHPHLALLLRSLVLLSYYTLIHVIYTHSFQFTSYTLYTLERTYPNILRWPNGRYYVLIT